MCGFINCFYRYLPILWFFSVLENNISASLAHNGLINLDCHRPILTKCSVCRDYGDRDRDRGGDRGGRGSDRGSDRRRDRSDSRDRRRDRSRSRSGGRRDRSRSRTPEKRREPSGLL